METQKKIILLAAICLTKITYAESINMSALIHNPDLLLTSSSLQVINNPESYIFDLKAAQPFVEKKGEYRLDIKKKTGKISRVAMAKVPYKYKKDFLTKELGQSNTLTHIQSQTTTFDDDGYLTSATTCSTIDLSLLIIEQKKHSCFTITPDFCHALAKDLPKMQREYDKLIECKSMIDDNQNFIKAAKSPQFLEVQKRNHKVIESQVEKVSPGKIAYTDLFGALNSVVATNDLSNEVRPKSYSLLIKMIEFRRLCLDHAKFFRPTSRTAPAKPSSQIGTK